MSKRKRLVSYGKCFLCGGSFAKQGIGRHLKKCVPAHDPPPAEGGVRLFHLSVDFPPAPFYWLHLEIPATASFFDLDAFLRAIWVECCDHLSAFQVDGVWYVMHLEEEEFEEELEFEEEEENDDYLSLETVAEHLGMSPEQLEFLLEKLFPPPPVKHSMSVPLEKALSVGKQFSYEYDFGTTTELRLKVVGERLGSSPSSPFNVRLLARNYAPIYRCYVEGCNRVGRWIDAWEFEVLCEEHARERPSFEERFLSIVNSPRVGQCGYTGPWREEMRFEEPGPEGKQLIL